MLVAGWSQPRLCPPSIDQEGHLRNLPFVSTYFAPGTFHNCTEVQTEIQMLDICSRARIQTLASPVYDFRV